MPDETDQKETGAPAARQQRLPLDWTNPPAAQGVVAAGSTTVAPPSPAVAGPAVEAVAAPPAPVAAPAVAAPDSTTLKILRKALIPVATPVTVTPEPVSPSAPVPEPAGNGAPAAPEKKATVNLVVPVVERLSPSAKPRVLVVAEAPVPVPVASVTALANPVAPAEPVPAVEPKPSAPSAPVAAVTPAAAVKPAPLSMPRPVPLAVKPVVMVAPAAVKPAPVSAASATPVQVATPKPTPASVQGDRARRSEAAVSGAPAASGGAVAARAPGVKLSFGRLLAETREQRKLSIADVIITTRVPKEFIEAAETGNLAAMPPPVYSKSHLRQLCKEYGMDPAPVLAEYSQYAEPKSGEAQNSAFVLTSEDHDIGAKVGYRPRPQKEAETTMKKMSPSVLAIIGVTLFLAVIILVSVAVSRHRAAKRSTVEGVAGGGTTTPAVDLDKFMAPQQLPMKELPVPSR